VAPPAGALITAVFDDSPAKKAGLNVEDVIVGVDGQPIRTSDELLQRIGDSRPGIDTRLRVFRAGANRDVTVHLGRQPDDVLSVRREAAVRAVEIDPHGLAALTLLPSQADRYGYSPNDRGALVFRVNGDSRLGSALEPGDLIVEANGRMINTATALREALEGRGGRVSLNVRTADGGTRQVFVDRQ
jgi:serine protease Do